jgi:hypothetical protein
VSRLGVLAIVLAACEHSDERKPPVPPPVPVDPRVACRADHDCEVFTACCWYCDPLDSTVVSVNKRHIVIGNALTTTDCPPCVDFGGCTNIAPSLAPICKGGTCALRETTYTDHERKKVANVVELDNAPGLLDRGEARIRAHALVLAVSHHVCARIQACGIKEPGWSLFCSPGFNRIPGVFVSDSDKTQTQACRKELDAIPCASLASPQSTTLPPACL